ncbi:MAG: c-type cytochrome [bacterium]
MTNLALVATLGFLLLLLLAMHTNPNKRNGYWLEGMADTVVPGDFDPSAYFPNGQTLQKPPEGTLAQGQQAYPFATGGVASAIAAGKLLKSPLQPPYDPATLLRGKILFERNCMPCHGAEARGDGVVPKHGFPPPPSLLAAHAKGLPDGYIYNYITRGGMLMPSYGAQIEPQERWKVIAWVRHMQKTFPENAPPAGSKQADLEAQLIPSTTPGYGYDGPPPYDETVADEALVQAQIDNQENPSPAEAFGAVASAAGASAAAAPTDPWGKAKAMIAKDSLDCFACHSVDHKVVGPAYMDVSKRYLGVPGIVDKLVAKVKAGGSGNWGNVPMVAHPNTPDADLRVVVEGILSLSAKTGAAKSKGGQSMAPRAPSMKTVLAVIHSGAPVHCPALDGQAINGPAWLDTQEESQAEVSRVSAADGPTLASLDASPDITSVVKETK